MAKTDGCFHPGHRPPVYPGMAPGTYTHTCTGCGSVQTFTVPSRNRG